MHRKENPGAEKQDMLDLMLEAADEKGIKLDDEEIIDVLVMYLNAGHESSGHTSMWATLYLQKNPEIMNKAKAEQEEIVRKRPPGQKGLTLKEIRQMEYLSRVVDETLRVVTFSLVVFREAKKDVNISGYTIPKGWKVLVWFRGPHFDILNCILIPTNSNLIDGMVTQQKQELSFPFGLGSRLCPGNDLAKLEINILLHYFLLNYELERRNPSCRIGHLPHPRPVDNCLGRIRKISPPNDLKKQN